MTNAEKEMFAQVIGRYQTRQPKAWEDWLRLRDQIRHDLKDEKFGTNVEGTMRHAASIPADLDKFLRNTAVILFNEPNYLNKDFLKAFPVFRVAQKL